MCTYCTVTWAVYRERAMGQTVADLLDEQIV